MISPHWAGSWLVPVVGVAMVSEPCGAGSGEAVAAGLSDCLAAAGVFVVGCDVADAGVEAPAVVVGSDDIELGGEHRGVADL